MSDEFVFIVPPSEGKSRTAPAKPSASTPAQQEGQRDLETYLNQMRERLADTVVDSPTHRRLLADIAAAEAELRGRTPSPKPAPVSSGADQVEFLPPDSSGVSEDKQAEQDNRVFNMSGISPTQERIGSAAVGAYAGAKAARPLERAFPPKQLRDLEGLQQFRNKLQAQQIIKEAGTPELQRFRPAVTANVPMAPGPTSPIGGLPSQLDVIQHATAGREPTSSLSRERGQQFGTKSTFEAGRAQKALLDDMIRRGLVPPTSLDELSLRLGTTVPASGESRVLTTQAGAYDVEQARAAEAERARRTAEAQRRVQELQQTRLARERTAAALSEASERARAAQTAQATAASQLAEATPGPLSQVAKAVGRPVMGGLAGVGAGLSFYEALQRWQQGDRSGSVIAALGGLGSAASLIPGLGVAGGAVGLASMPAMYINDILKGKIAPPERLPEVDVMGNPVGSYQ